MKRKIYKLLKYVGFSQQFKTNVLKIDKFSFQLTT